LLVGVVLFYDVRMRTLLVVVALVGVVLTGCGGEQRQFSLCELAFGAKVVARGTLQAGPSDTATLHVLEALKGPSQDLTFTGDATHLAAARASGGSVFVFAWTTLSGTSDMTGQGVFWPGVGGDFGNGRTYQPQLGVFEDGGTVVRGGVTEAELRAQVAAAAGFSKLEQCHTP
jgi:hypothetical protein